MPHHTKKVEAVVFPLEDLYIDRFFNGGKDIFIKFPTHEILPEVTKSSKRLVFYASRADKTLRGEAVIKKVNLISLKDARKIYGGRIFLDTTEISQYAKGRTKKILVFELGKLKKYQTPIPWKKPMTMVGCYLTGEEYRKATNMNLAA
jgi:hypothetical protein